MLAMLRPGPRSLAAHLCSTSPWSQGASQNLHNCQELWSNDCALQISGARTMMQAKARLLVLPAGC